MSCTTFVIPLKPFYVNKLYMVFVLKPLAATDAKQGKRLEKSLFCDMQRKGEAASLIELTGHAHFLAEVLHDFVSDGKP